MEELLPPDEVELLLDEPPLLPDEELPLLLPDDDVLLPPVEDELLPPDEDDPPLDDVLPPDEEPPLDEELPPVEEPPLLVEDELLPPDEVELPPPDDVLLLLPPDEDDALPEPPPPFAMAVPAVFMVEDRDPPSPAKAAIVALAISAANSPYSTLVTPRQARRRVRSFACIALPLCGVEGAMMNRFYQISLNSAIFTSDAS